MNWHVRITAVDPEGRKVQLTYSFADGIESITDAIRAGKYAAIRQGYSVPVVWAVQCVVPSTEGAES